MLQQTKERIDEREKRGERGTTPTTPRSLPISMFICAQRLRLHRGTSLKPLKRKY
ncbi:hypothetical protein V6Z12_A12G225800 [Gossypium hirsutum]